jgi:hypothetical protein
MSVKLSDVLAIIGAVTGIIALSVTFIKEFIRDRPVIKIFKATQSLRRGITLKITNADANGKIGVLDVRLYFQISNSGLRPTSITSSNLIIFGKSSKIVCDEWKKEKHTDSDVLPAYLHEQISGYKLDSGEYIEGEISYIGEFTRNFVFSTLKGELMFTLSHTKKPVRKKNIALDNFSFLDGSGKSISPKEALDSSFRLKDEFLSTFIEKKDQLTSVPHI